MAGSSVIGALRVNLGIDSAEFSNGLKLAQSGLARFGSLAKTGLKAAGVAAAVAIGESVSSTIDAADDMSKAASKIGIPIEELSRLKYAADLSGVSFEGLQTTVGKLSKNMVAAADGNKAVGKAFADAGIQVTNADGSLKSSSEVMAQLADKFAAMPDGADKTALALQLMGKSGADMIPLLNGGSAALNQLMGEADQFGQVFTASMGKDAEAFNDNMSRLQGAFGKVAADIASKLLPYMAQFSDWLVDNAPNIGAVVQTLVDWGVSIVQLGVDIAGAVAGGWSDFSAWWERMKGLANDAGQSILAFKDRVVEVGAEIVEVFAGLPAAMVEIGEQILEGLWQGIKAKYNWVKDQITGLGTNLLDSFKSVWDINSPSKVMAGVGVNIMEGLGQGMESMAGSIGQFADSIGQTIGDSFAQVITGSKTVGQALKDIAKQVLAMAGNSLIKSIFGGALSGGGFGGFFKSILSFDGGGYTGSGPRSGGLDGKGGFMAMLHPNEQVNDLTRGQGFGGGAQEVVIRGVFVDDNGVIKARIDQTSQNMGVQAKNAAVSEVRGSLPIWSKEIRKQGSLA